MSIETNPLPPVNPLIKAPGAPKELHERCLGNALPVFNVDQYVEDFNASVIGAYRRGTADVELPADMGVARSLIPPGTAAVRDFTSLAPTIPDFDRERCVGCMTCVNICPDTAILAKAIPTKQLDDAITTFVGQQQNAALAETTVRAHFSHTTKYADVPAKRGIEPAQFGIFVNPHHCKGCGECVEVCHSLGYDALAMVRKVAAEETGEPTIDRYRRDFSFFQQLPTTPKAYRNEKALADIMLSEHAIGFTGGAGSCAGCGETTAVRMLVAATRHVYGPEGMGIVAATGCNTVYGSTYPFNPFLVPWTNSLFENCATVALGVRERWVQDGHPERRLWAFGGDGAMYDIGFQALSRMMASGLDVKALVLDTQVYSNTGGQSSTASFGGQVTKLSAFGKSVHGWPQRRKELGLIMLAHREVYVACTTAAHINHFMRAVMEANEYPGPAVIIAYTPCMPEHGIGDDAASAQAKFAVESRAFPLFTYDPRRGETVAQRLSLQGNPSMKEDWAKQSDGSTLTFLDFARSEGRFAQHFRGGEPSPEIKATQDDRLAYWRQLQELAGIR
jgi:pyruvate ferredoxin oxidoreductase beta subunit